MVTEPPYIDGKWRDFAALPDVQKRLIRKQREAIRREREALDDTPEGQDRRWGPLRLKRPNRQRRHKQ